MFTYEIQESGDIMVLTSKGLTTVEDYQTMAPKFFEDVNARNIRKILIDARMFEGWDSRQSESISFMSWSQARSLFDCIAVVVHDSTKSDVARFLEFFQNAGKNVRVFQPAQYESALEWLKRHGTTNE
ncbi:MAG: STAS/SEC14 domain-containing protein [Anderseniella sp.]